VPLGEKLIYKEGPEPNYRGYEIIITEKPPGWQAAIYPTRPNMPNIDCENEPINEMTEAAARAKALLCSESIRPPTKAASN